MSGRGRECVKDWFNFCREVCSETVSVVGRGQMMGKANNPVQTEEAYFAGRLKYNRRRLLRETILQRRKILTLSKTTAAMVAALMAKTRAGCEALRGTEE